MAVGSHAALPEHANQSGQERALRLTAEVCRVDTTLYSLFLYLHSTKQLEALGPVPLSPQLGC